MGQIPPGVSWAYRNTPHDSTNEKPSFLLFGMELRSPTEPILLPAESVEPADLSDYREQLMLSLSSARELVVNNIYYATLKKYKRQYYKKSWLVSLEIESLSGSLENRESYLDRGMDHIASLPKIIQM